MFQGEGGHVQRSCGRQKRYVVEELTEAAVCSWSVEREGERDGR